jgi:hypothetical protein
MTVRLNRDLTTFNYLKNEYAKLAQGSLFSASVYDNTGPNEVTDPNGRYVIPGQYIDYVGEDEPDGI